MTVATLIQLLNRIENKQLDVVLEQLGENGVDCSNVQVRELPYNENRRKPSGYVFLCANEEDNYETI